MGSPARDISNKVSSDTGDPPAWDVLWMGVLMRHTQNLEKSHFGLAVRTNQPGWLQGKSAAGKKATKRVPELELR